MNRCLLSCQTDMFCNIFCKLILSIVTNNPVQFTLAISIYDIFRSLGLPLIHTHIQRHILPVRKTAFCMIQLIGRYSQIQHNTINRVDSPFF